MDQSRNRALAKYGDNQGIDSGKNKPLNQERSLEVLSNASGILKLSDAFDSETTARRGVPPLYAGPISLNVDIDYSNSSSVDTHNKAEASIMSSDLNLFSGSSLNTSIRNLSATTPERSVQFGRVLVTDDQDKQIRAPPQPSQKTEAGHRQGSGEGSELCNSGHILQHLAESYQDYERQRSPMRSCRLSSDGSVFISPTKRLQLTGSPDDLDTIEAEIDSLKKEVSVLKEASLSGPAKVSEEGARQGNYIACNNEMRQVHNRTEPIRVYNESPAAKLLKQHVLADGEPQRQHNGPSGEDHDFRTDSFEFPFLTDPFLTNPGQNSIQAAIDSGTGVHATNRLRKASYANVLRSPCSAVENIRDCVESPRSCCTVLEPSARKNTIPGKTKSVRIPDGHTSLLRSPKNGSNCSNTTKSIFETDKPTKSPTKRPLMPLPTRTPNPAPRFAQATQSSTRKTESSLHRLRHSPSKSVDTPATRTIKEDHSPLVSQKLRDGHQLKRKSLPGNWIQTLATQDEVTPISVHLNTGPSSAMKQPVTTSALKTCLAMQDPPADPSSYLDVTVHKRERQNKHASYMAPTLATIQRSIGTLDNDLPGKKEGNFPSKPALRINTGLLHNTVGLVPDTETANGSEASSVLFILEKPNKPSLSQPATTHKSLPCSSQGLEGRTLIGYTEPMVEGITPFPRFSTELAEQVAFNLEASKRGMPGLPESGMKIGEIPNVTRKRRTSHGSILAPIVACLDNQGLLNHDPLRRNSVVQRFLREKESRRRADSVNDSHGTDARKTCTLLAAPSKGLGRAVDGCIPVGPHTFPVLQRGSGGPTRHRVSQSLTTPISSEVIWQATELAENNTRPTPNLRATAKEFTPSERMTRSFSQTVKQLSQSGALGYYTPEQWARLPPDTRQAISILRNHAASPTTPTPFPIPERAFIHPLTQYPVSPSSWNATSGNPSGVSTSSVANGTNKGEQSACETNTSPSLRQQNTLCHYQYAGFLQPPIVTQIPNYVNYLAPQSSSNQLAGWAAEPIPSQVSYGWLGGDGKEIRFVSHGPFTEHDPNRGGSFTIGSPSALSRKNFRNRAENSFPSDKVAPRSMRQWAEKCGNKLEDVDTK